MKILEKERKIDVIAEADVVVAGGGPAGFAAAISAARNNVSVLLVERYGYLGGLATGGLVICLVETDRYGYGICKEVVEKLFELDAAKLNKASGETPRWVEGTSLSGEESVNFDPEALKLVANEMITDSGADLLLHSLVVGAIVKENEVQGIILEGKSGRKAVLGKIFVDATGDGDLAAASGAPFHLDRHPWGINLDFRLGGVDVERTNGWRRENPEKYKELMNRLEKEVGMGGWATTIRKDAVWGGGPHFYDADGLNVRDLTRVEVESRRRIRAGLEFYRKNVPGFELAFLMETASQIGVRETRRITGEYTLTKEDVVKNRRFEDAIARSLFDIPYRCLLPVKVESLLTAGRCISTTREAQGVIRNIPPCLITGQAAGTAAALSVREKVTPRRLSISLLKENLRRQGVKV